MVTKKATTTRKKALPKRKISAEDISLRAQRIYHERINNGVPGDELSDWLSAERELMGTR